MAAGGRIIIKGVTNQGRRFRPSDWAQRLATAVARQGPGRRIVFHPRVHLTSVDGVSAVAVERDLEEEDPMLFEFLTKFARNNDLEMVEE